MVCNPPITSAVLLIEGLTKGHAGHATVDYAAEAITALVKQSLESFLRTSRTPAYAPEKISGILADAITRFDNTLTGDFVNLFPGGLNGLLRMADGQIRQIVDDRSVGGRNWATAVRCLQGSTALLSLTDPTKSHLWIANLGDCQAGTF